MEAKFFAEIEKRMSVKTLKDFEKEIRTKIQNEFESLRKKNEDLARVLMTEESYMWNKIRFGEYSWLNLDATKNKKLFRMIDIYSNFNEILDSVKELHKNVEKVKQLKSAPDEED